MAQLAALGFEARPGMNPREDEIAFKAVLRIVGTNDRPEIDSVGVVAPVMAADPYAPDHPSQTGTFVASDADRGESANGVTFEVAGMVEDTSETGFTHRVDHRYGTLWFNEDSPGNTGDWRFDPDAAAIDALSGGQTAEAIFRVRAHDGTEYSNYGGLQFPINRINYAPTLEYMDDEAADGTVAVLETQSGPVRGGGLVIGDGGAPLSQLAFKTGIVSTTAHFEQTPEPATATEQGAPGAGIDPINGLYGRFTFDLAGNELDWSYTLYTGPKPVFLCPHSRAVLDGIKSPRRGPVFPARKGRKRIDVKEFWVRTRKEAGLEDVRLHDLRHHYATTAVLLGVNIRILGKLLGHNKPETTMRYAHPDDMTMRNAANTVGGALSGRKEGEVQ